MKYGFVTNKTFWSIIKPSLTNKGDISREEIILKTDCEIITDSTMLDEMSNSHFINIFKKVFRKKKQGHSACDKKISDTTPPIDLIVQSYLYHSSISHIKTTSKSQTPSFTFSNNFVGQINKK